MKRDFLTYLKEAWNPDLHPEDFIKNHPTLNLTNGDINISLTYDEKKKKYLASPETVAQRAYRDIKKGKEMCVPTASMRAARFFSKILPHAWLMKIYKK